MKRSKKSVLILTLLMSAVFVASVAMAQSSSQVITLQPGESVEIICEGDRLRIPRVNGWLHREAVCEGQVMPPTAEPTEEPTVIPPTSTATAEPTEEPTSVPPTSTATAEPTVIPPTAEPTEEPTAVPTTPPGGNIQPYAGAPACPDSAHDKEVYHGLWNYDLGCHYDHTHNADPNAVNDVFGEPGAWYGSPGQSVSHPWQTWAGLDQGFGPQPGAMENDAKHNGYKWDVQSQPGCHRSRTITAGPNCVSRWRILYHWQGGGLATNVRFHSILYEIEMCTPNMQECGIIRGGGVWDTGFVMSPYKGGNCGNGSNGDWQALPQDPPGIFNCATPPYRGHATVAEAEDFSARNGQVRSRWNARYHSPRGGVEWFQDIDYSRIAEVDVLSQDDWGGSPFNPQTGMFEEHFICEDGSCPYNHSHAIVYEVVLNSYVDAFDQSSEPGIQFTGWTNRKMHVLGAAEAAVCAANGPSMDCVPLSVEGIPAGGGYARFQQGQYLPEDDHDIYFGDQPSGWIQWPN